MTFLARIAESRALRVEQARRITPLASLQNRCGEMPGPIDAAARLAAWPPKRRAVIAEIKRRSPSKGDLRPDLDPEPLARAYRRAGAFGISVLTEPDHFGGRLEDLRVIRQAVDLPLLYKDFVVDPYQVWEARSAGADLVLLIVALLGERTPEYVGMARDVGLEPLVEVHGAAELDAALASGARFVGINNRDLKTFRVDLGVTRDLLPRIPPHVLAVSESGFRRVEDLDELGRAGARAFLIGEALVREPDPEVALRRFVGPRR